MLDKSQRLKETLLNNHVYMLEPDCGFVVGNFMFTTEEFKQKLQDNLMVVQHNNLITSLNGIEIITTTKEILLMQMENFRK